MTGSPHTHLTPDLPPAVEVPDLPGAHDTSAGANAEGDRRDRRRNRPGTPPEKEGPSGKGAGGSRNGA
ncbi:hypothetical protein V2S66_00825 [Streptomyces sp. V4-01]|uniref:Uncharacterized protein n=1 Tax=Actinacidiphila polyblastidii TaxID=3110430 RepID=A0ABU7P3W7_9ACTN|nr:hypothetical protein [Streptomyces sp. V4-01]